MATQQAVRLATWGHIFINAQDKSIQNVLSSCWMMVTRTEDWLTTKWAKSWGLCCAVLHTAHNEKQEAGNSWTTGTNFPAPKWQPLCPAGYRWRIAYQWQLLHWCTQLGQACHQNCTTLVFWGIRRPKDYSVLLTFWEGLIQVRQQLLSPCHSDRKPPSPDSFPISQSNIYFWLHRLVFHLPLSFLKQGYKTHPSTVCSYMLL